MNSNVFEAKILSTVKSAVGGVPAEFFNGTLFVTCTSKESAKIESALMGVLDGRMGVIVTPGAETSFDFV